MPDTSQREKRRNFVDRNKRREAGINHALQQDQARVM
jgi:hypothetical protein